MEAGYDRFAAAAMSNERVVPIISARVVSLQSGPSPPSVHMGVLRNWLTRVANQLVEQPVGVPPARARVAPIDLADAIADTEYAIRPHEVFKRAFGAWLKLHIARALALYALLALHVWSGIFFGLRWFR